MGDPVAHSLSPFLHNTAFSALGLDWASAGLAVPAAGLAGRWPAGPLGFAGVSVTMPHKAAAARLVDERRGVAARLGAVNCTWWPPDRLIGDNTDGAGFVASLGRGAAFDPTGRRCLVQGAGGAARAVMLALADAGAAEVVVLNRSPERAEPGGGPGGGGRTPGGTRGRRVDGPGGPGHPGRHGRHQWAGTAPAVDPRDAPPRSGGRRPHLPPPAHGLAGGGRAPPGPRWWEVSACWCTRRRCNWPCGPGSTPRWPRCGRPSTLSGRRPEVV